MIILICARNEMWLFPGLNAVCILICGPKLETRLTPCGQKVVRFRIYRSNLRSQVKHSQAKVKLLSHITFDRNFVDLSWSWFWPRFSYFIQAQTGPSSPTFREFFWSILRFLKFLWSWTNRLW